MLLVVAYHAWGLPAAGYLGVDIFFVVSGFLITGLVARAIDEERFSAREFYLRRARRLLPAAYVVLASCCLAAPWLLTYAELKAFWAQVVGAVTLSSNIVLWRQGGYFAGDAELKPLLHFWSLAIEEQYYLLLPAALVLMPRRRWKVAMLGCVAASFGLAVYGAAHHPDATFYWLPTRAWELGIGSLGALAAWRAPLLHRLLAAAFWPAVAVLVAVPLAATRFVHPGPMALLVCVATLVALARWHEGAQRLAVVRGLARVGDISYSLYLVHWPLLAFLRSASLEEPSLAWRTAAALVSFPLAWLLWRFVETPWRDPRRLPRLVPWALMGVAMVMTAGSLVARMAWADNEWVERLAPNHGLGLACAHA